MFHLEKTHIARFTSPTPVISGQCTHVALVGLKLFVAYTLLSSLPLQQNLLWCCSTKSSLQ